MNSQPTADHIDHVAIEVEDISAAVEWYRSHFQCTVDYQDETWAMLGFGNVRLAFVSAGQHPPHIGIVSPKAEDYGELKMHRDGTRSTYISDPSGNAVELLAADQASFVVVVPTQKQFRHVKHAPHHFDQRLLPENATVTRCSLRSLPH